MALRQTVVNPLGLVTTPNHYGQYPEGALSTADNVVMRNAGELWTAPGVTTFTVGSTNDFLRKQMPLDNGKVYDFIQLAALTTWTVQQNASSVTLPSLVSTTNLFTGGRICPVRSRERMLVNSNKGVLVGDFMDPTSAAQRELRSAGMTQPTFSISTTQPGPIPIGIMVAYAVLFTREFADGYIVKSVPAPLVKVLNSSGATVLASLIIDWSTTTGLLAGDFIEIYRTDGLVTASTDADPGTTLKLVKKYQLTSTDITAGLIVLADQQLLLAPYYATSGRELYTNPYQEGSTGANRQPDICGAVGQFKGFTFYGNITERPQWTFAVPAGFGDVDGGLYLNTPALRANGLGRRDGVGTTAIGSPTITGVSAADIVGIKIGQQWLLSASAFPQFTAVTAVGATTITMAVNATAVQGTFQLGDVFQLNGGNIWRFSSAPSFTTVLADGGLFEVTTNQTMGGGVNYGGAIWTVEPIRPSSSTTITVHATNGANYSPAVPEFTATAQTFSQTTTKNLVRWSKDSEPEHVPAVNETQVGAATIIQFVSTKDALWIFCTDGIYRLSGAGGAWVVDIIDPGCILCAPQCAVAMREQVFAYTNYGFVVVTNSGVVPISASVIKELMPGQPFAELADVIVERNETDREVLISLGASTNTLYIYNEERKAFTRLFSAGTGLQAITSIAFQTNPTSGVAVPLIGASPSAAQPRYGSWNVTNPSLAPTVKFQPFYAKAPMMVKQWIDMTFIFAPADATKSVSGLVGSGGAGFATLVTHDSNATDSYATMGVTRSFAMAPYIEPGWFMSSLSSTSKFRGVSVRYAPVTEQQVRR